MSDTEPSWDLYGAFLAVMQGGSLSAAARSLGVTQPTVRRQIEKLESMLGVVLFTRASNGLVPTELAIATLPHAESIAATARAFVRSVSGATDGDRGTVRLACSEVVGIEVLPPMLAELIARHPRLQLELVLSNRNEDLLRRDADLAVRMARPTQEGLVTRKVGRIELGLFATDAYLAHHRAPAKLGDLLRDDHALVGRDRDRGIIGALAHAGLPTRPRDYALRTDSDVAQLAAVRAGLGIGICQVPIARRDPALRRVLPSLRFDLETWVVMHEDLRTARRVRLVFDHLVDRLARYASSDLPASGARKKKRSEAPRG